MKTVQRIKVPINRETIKFNCLESYKLDFYSPPSYTKYVGTENPITYKYDWPDLQCRHCLKFYPAEQFKLDSYGDGIDRYTEFYRCPRESCRTANYFEFEYEKIEDVFKEIHN